MTTKPVITRQDIADMLDVSVRSVRRNEKRWGLDKCRVSLNSRCVRFRTVAVTRILVAMGAVE